MVSAGVPMDPVLAVMIPHVLPLNSASDRMVAGAKNARREAA
jgi:hypothetical protein